MGENVVLQYHHATTSSTSPASRFSSFSLIIREQPCHRRSRRTDLLLKTPSLVFLHYDHPGMPFLTTSEKKGKNTSETKEVGMLLPLDKHSRKQLMEKGEEKSRHAVMHTTNVKQTNPRSTAT